jgi:hypothetical protein
MIHQLSEIEYKSLSILQPTNPSTPPLIHSSMMLSPTIGNTSIEIVRVAIPFVALCPH